MSSCFLLVERFVPLQVGRSIAIQEIVDPDVLGGIRVELGDEVIEGTVADRLQEARRLFG